MLFNTKLIKRILVTTSACVLLITGGMAIHTVSAQAKGNYTVKVSTKPCNTAYTKAGTYNKNTKQYYMLRSYLEKLEKKGGGTLTLKKGTYNVPCTLYVPSNVTIKLKSGAILKKTIKTGSKKLKADDTLLALVPPSKSAKKNAVKKYAGSSNVTIEGSGSATINLNNNATGSAVAIGHNKKVTIRGIKFKNMSGGSFINIAASKNVTINKCTFTGFKAPADTEARYAIRLEIPDTTTKAYTYTWSKADKTANTGITISDNKFTNLCSAIGSSKYTEKVYQAGIKITGNTLEKLTNHGIRLLNWTGTIITGNTFRSIADGTGSFCGVYASGAVNPSIMNNTFDYVAIPINIVPASNTGSGKKYATTFNTIPANFSTDVVSNIVTNALVYYVPYQSSAVATTITRLAYYVDNTTKDYVISAGCNPYRDHYTDDKWYNEYTKDYYVFRSYLEQLERVGGGTLTVQSGNYSITNTLFVPSNTTITFQHGVNIKKGTYTGFNSTVLAPSLSLFQLVPPSQSTGVGVMSAYNGAHDIKFIGQGTVTIDLLYFNCCKAIVMGHNSNVLIQNINFHNYMGHHFIELDASKNVTIQGCTFQGSSFTGSSDDYKEAINIDTPDKNTGGFNQTWTSYDRTPNDTIIIQNNTFFNVLRAIGTHKYSVSPVDNQTQLYHSNVQILSNNITNTNSYAIRSINWKDCIIKGNTIKNVGSGKTTAILMSGTVNPTITENIFDTALRPITLNTKDNSDSKLADKAYPATHTILDSNEESGVNLTAMLNNTLIDMSGSNRIYFYIGGNSKENSIDVKRYDFDESHISYTYPTATPVPTTEPTTEPSTEPTANPDATAGPSASPVPDATASPEPSPNVTDGGDDTENEAN